LDERQVKIDVERAFDVVFRKKQVGMNTEKSSRIGKIKLFFTTEQGRALGPLTGK
jgi:hypothetical protein